MRRLLIVAAVVAWAAPSANAAHIPGCNTSSCDERVKQACWADRDCRERVIRKQQMRVASPYWGIFNAIAECESNGNWQINSLYDGGIQFDPDSWRAVGGKGYAWQATKLEQIYRGVLLMRLQGWNAWPNCRRAAGV